MVSRTEAKILATEPRTTLDAPVAVDLGHAANVVCVGEQADDDGDGLGSEIFTEGLGGELYCRASQP